MNGDSRNIDSIIDEKLKHSLIHNTSDGFSDELVKRINLEKEFAMQDVKTSKIAKLILGGFISFLVFISVILGLLLKSHETAGDTNIIGSFINKFSGFVENFSTSTFFNLGFTFSQQSLIILLLVMVFIFIFSFADKILFRKS